MMGRVKRAMYFLTLTSASFLLARRWSQRAPRPATARLQEHPRASEKGKWRLGKISIFLAALAVAGFGVAASGIVPIRASSGHWAITSWFLHFSMRRSIATYSLGIEVPALDAPRLILQGAGHYETGCRPCHGSPQLPHPRIPQAMTPHPPYLPPRLATWEPAELFSIVKHGVKFTGMPAWPAPQRDDEVWAIVAFLLVLPELTSEEYRRLVYNTTPSKSTVPPSGNLPHPEQVPQAVLDSCGRCHGVDGNGRENSAFPRLAGQRPAYLYAALQAFARGARPSGMMEPIAAALSPAEMRQLAHYYASQPASAAPSVASPPGAIERGKSIASQGIPQQRLASCVDCHGPGATRRHALYPILAGQYADYLVQQLELFQKQQRGGSAYAHLMEPVVARLTPQQMRDVALYYASLSGTAAQAAQESR